VDVGGFAEPRFQFDPVSGKFRTRYAATRLVGAFVSARGPAWSCRPLAGHYLIRLVTTRSLRVLDLRTERNLDALDVDDRSTPASTQVVWGSCQHLADAARAWWPT
jgi:hypothetical protein